MNHIYKLAKHFHNNHYILFCIKSDQEDETYLNTNENLKINKLQKWLFFYTKLNYIQSF